MGRYSEWARKVTQDFSICGTMNPSYATDWCDQPYAHDDPAKGGDEYVWHIDSRTGRKWRKAKAPPCGTCGKPNDVTHPRQTYEWMGEKLTRNIHPATVSGNDSEELK